MTDWERVERLRTKGRSWDSIASDPKVGFHAPEATENRGAALKALYFQRRSRSHRNAGGPRMASEGNGATSSSGARRHTRFFRWVAGAGIVVVLAAGIPAAASVGVSRIASLIPLVALVSLAGFGALLLGVGLAARRGRALRLWRQSAAVGVALGLVAVAVLYVAALTSGCPTLAAASTSEPGPSGDTGWMKAPNPVWTSGGAPVLFYYSAAGCPYCAAASWAVHGALRNFSSALSGTTLTYSNPNEGAISSIAEVDFVGSTSTGGFVAWDSQENAQTQSVVLPTLSCPESSYVTAYDQGTNNGCNGVPLVVVGGVYIHVGYLVAPSVLAGLTTSQVAADLAAGNSGSPNAVWNAIHPVQIYLEAYLLMGDRITGVTAPTGVASNSEVLSDASGIV